MQIEHHPHAAPTGIVEFLKQYAMIVLSILTALGLEHVAVSLHDRSAAQASRGRIEAELAHDLADLQDSQRANKASVDVIKAAMHTLMDVLKTGTPDSAKTMAIVQPALNNMQVALSDWQRTAWDSALADGSAAHLPPADLRRYSEIYVSSEGVSRVSSLLMSGEWLTEASDEFLDARLGHADGRRIAATLKRYLLAAEQIEQSQESLSKLVSTGQPSSPIPPPAVKP